MPEQMLAFLEELFLQEGLILLIGSFILGQIIKSFPKINNKHIPAIVTVVAIIVAVASNIAGSALLPESDLFITGFKGMILGWASTGGYELFAKSEWFHKIFGSKENLVQ